MTAQPGATAPSPRRTAERVLIASYDGYLEAERAADHLFDEGFAAHRTVIIGLIAHALRGGRRDFASIGAMAPTRHLVVADSEVAHEVRALLAKLPPAAGGA